MLNFRSMAKSASRRKEMLESKISSARSGLAAMEAELKVLETILAALPKGAAKVGPGRPRGTGRKRKGGKWRPGKPGRPPKWYLDQQKAKGKGAKTARAQKPAKAAKVRKPIKKKRGPASEKQLAAMAKAREALAAKRAAQAAAPKPE